MFMSMNWILNNGAGSPSGDPRIVAHKFICMKIQYLMMNILLSMYLTQFLMLDVVEDKYILRYKCHFSYIYPVERLYVLYL